MKYKHRYFFKVLFASITLLIATTVYAHSAPATPTNLRFKNTIHYFTGLPMTTDGWTDLLAMYKHPDRYNNSRIVYVSTSGNDGTGTSYSPGDPAIGSDPFNPSGTISPYATFTAAYAQLRDGYPDMLLLKRGDTWTEFPYTSLSKSGRSKFERQIIASYGGANVRPVVATSSAAFSVRDSATVNYLIVADLELTPHNRQVSEGPNGISWEGTGHHLLFEGNYIHGYRNNMVFQDPTKVVLTSNIALRRNVIADAWRSDGHCQGIYTAFIGNFLIEENVWDHNGWHETYQNQNTHSRNMYLDHYSDMTIRGNIDARSSSEGVQMRYGGTYEYNLSLQNTAAVWLGHAQTQTDITGKIRKNVVLDARDIEDSPRGWGIVVGNRTNNVEIDDNIVAHQKTATGAMALYVTNETEMFYQEDPDPGYVYTNNPIFTNNIVYKWDLNGAASGYAMYIGQSAVGITVRNNIMYQPNGAMLVYYYTGSQHNGPDETWVFEGNTYYAGSNTTPFDGRSLDDMTYTEWVTHASETGSSNRQVNFPDPERTIESYAQARGLNPAGYQDGLEKFLTEARKQSRFNWRKEYTAFAVINYIREGFGREYVSFSYAAH